ncbi:hypothetical protein [Bradyrhizobium sp. AS23.2]|uniref:hypothetical protein n=1 Tax=Bradyrhizobium sp. AS23.2 TaxID=1680155 RepID=UPI00093DB1C2|nr:hypothetical protein [Bradyrhizobium sp. AS23.2]OKO80246.1 hypothetical protein AC630_16085 [Bradyrhizobium sp. AS23.2]
MSSFNHGISDKFTTKLALLAESAGWWRDVLHDPSLIIAVRENYLNVYWLGQAIFIVRMQEDKISVRTHAKYLLNPNLDDQIPLIDGKFDFTQANDEMLTSDYKSGETLVKLKRAAEYYSGKEKEGVHRIVSFNPSIVDVEIAVSANGLPGVGKLPRIDIAAFEDGNDGINLALWEAKRFTNKELTNGKIKGQLEKYMVVVAKYRDDLERSYRRVAKNLVAIAEMSNGKRTLAPVIARVAQGDDPLIVSQANIGLLVFGFDATQKAAKDKEERTVRDKMEVMLKDLGLDKKRRLRFLGKADGIRL